MNYKDLVRFTDLIDMMKSGRKVDFCVYGRGSTEDIELNTECMIGEYPEITDEDEEIFPSYVVVKGLEFWFRDELIEDVVLKTIHQKKDVNNQVIIKAIKYYNNYDAFMDVS